MDSLDLEKIFYELNSVKYNFSNFSLSFNKEKGNCWTSYSIPQMPQLINNRSIFIAEGSLLFDGHKFKNYFDFSYWLEEENENLLKQRRNNRIYPDGYQDPVDYYDSVVVPSENKIFSSLSSEIKIVNSSEVLLEHLASHLQP